jgi:hypothetical protein
MSDTPLTDAAKEGGESWMELAALSAVLERENATLRAEVDQWASRCAAAIWMLPETVTGGQLVEAQDKFHRERENLRRENAALLKALKEIEAYGPHDGCCRYGCDTPGIAMAAIDAARKEAKP